MRLFSAFCIAGIVTATQAPANEKALLECLQERLVVEAIGFGPVMIEDREIKIRVTNNLSIPLGGVMVDFTIWAKERPIAIYSASIREAATIPGGLLPGESLEASDYHFMEEREKEFARQTEELRLDLVVRNAADINMDGFFDHPRMGSWSGEFTDAPCK